MTRSRLCHWPDCNVKVVPKMLCCPTHWHRIPKELQAKVWANYREGQELDGLPSREYVLVLREVRDHALKADGKPIPGTPTGPPAPRQKSMF